MQDKENNLPADQGDEQAEAPETTDPTVPVDQASGSDDQPPH